MSTPVPSWAKFFKYYIKDNYSTEYNLQLDRFYDSEDGNYWLSFPSAERNKITEDDILMLKKQHGEDLPVIEDNEYRVIDIKNEPPDSLKLTNLPINLDQLGLTLNVGYNTWNIGLYKSLRPFFNKNIQSLPQGLEQFKVGLIFYIL